MTKEVQESLVIDLSHYNQVTDYGAVAGRGVVGVIHKASEGTTLTDVWYARREPNFRRLGLLWGAYHFLRPGNIPVQVNHFWEAARPKADTLLAVDYEDEKVSVTELQLFVKLLQERSGRVPFLYSGFLIKERISGHPDPLLTRCPLWLAQYGPKAVLPRGWGKWTLWQYSEKGQLAGIGGGVDLSRFSGSAAQLASIWPGELLGSRPTVVVAPDGDAEAKNAPGPVTTGPSVAKGKIEGSAKSA